MSQAKELRLTKEDLTLVHSLLQQQQQEIDKLKKEVARVKSELEIATYNLRRILKK